MLIRSVRGITLVAVVALAAILLPLRSRPAAVFAQSAGANLPLVLVGEKIYVSPFADPIDDGEIVIQSGKITAVGRKGKIVVPEESGYFDCTGLYVAAGFQNSHVHFTEPKWASAAKLPAPQLTAQLEQLLTRYGFTTVVDTGSLINNTVVLRQRIESGEVTGPRILTSGIPLYPHGAIPYYVKNSTPPDELKQLYDPSTPAEAVHDVDQNIAAGADIIKLFTGSWISKDQIVPMAPSIASAAVQEAHSHQRLVFAHPSNLLGFQIALQARVDVLAHAVDDTRGWSNTYLKQMRAQQMWMIPTLSLFTGDSNYADILAEVHAFSQDHGKFLFGTDAGFRSDYDPSPEYLELSRAGLSFAQILDSLTTAPAARFGESLRRGQIKAGMDADLVVLSADPEQDIRNLARVSYTFRNGQIIYSIANQ
ncbi:MAG TPA: amidohydrolase family protein [Candidatus Acidoferrales bacterium]|nr:amidohydrolase family protein [Candidatus Acidoferrales bacterium]